MLRKCLSILLFFSLAPAVQAQWTKIYTPFDSCNYNAHDVGGIVIDSALNIYIGGNIQNSAGNAYVCMYNGFNNIELGGFNAFGNSPALVNFYLDSLNNLYVSQAVNTSGHPFINKWDGNAWGELGGFDALQANGWIGRIAGDHQGNIYCAGAFTNDSGKCYVAKYNGSSWSELGGLNALHANFGFNSLCTDVEGNVYATGHFTTGPTNQQGMYYIAKFDGSTWSDITTNSNLDTIVLNGTDFLSLKSDHQGNIYCLAACLAEQGNWCFIKYDGTKWVRLSSPPNFYMNPIPAFYNHIGDIYTVDKLDNLITGIYMTDSFLVTHFYPMKFDGNNWSVIGTPGSYPDNSCNGIATDNYGGIYYISSHFDTTVCPQYPPQYVAKYQSPVGVPQVNNYYPVQIYPNPASSNIEITCSNIIQQIQITDIFSKIVYTNSKQQQTLSIDVSAWPSGLYFCRLKAQSSFFTKKVVVIH